MLMYLSGSFPDIKSRFFEYQKQDNFDKLMNWYINTLKPNCDSIIRCFVKVKSQAEIKKEVKRFEILLANMEKMLKDQCHGEFFSGNDSMAAVDVVLYFQVSTIIKICST